MSERIALTTADGCRLDAVLEPGTKGAAVIAPPHPLMGGELNNPVVSAVAAGLRNAGYAVLRFDYRGIGRSEGTANGDVALAVADYAAALEQLVERCSGPYVAAGYSYGGAVALRAAVRATAVQCVLAVAPPVVMLDRASLDRLAVPLSVIVGDGDSYAPLAKLESALKACAQARLEVLPDTDHFFSLETELLEAWAQRAVSQA